MEQPRNFQKDETNPNAQNSPVSVPNASNQSTPTFSTNNKRYKLRIPKVTSKSNKQLELPIPQEKNLLVIHSLKDGSLPVVSQTGLASPSLAVIHKDFPWHGFGNITLVAHPAHINPKRTPVYNKDAWSPRFKAKVVEEGELDPEKWEAFKKEVHAAADKVYDLQNGSDLPDGKKQYMDEVARVLGELPGNVKTLNRLSHVELSYTLPMKVMDALTPGGYFTQPSEHCNDYWKPKIQTFFPTKKYAQFQDGTKIELTPENEKAIVREMRGGGSIKGGEYGGMKKLKLAGHESCVLADIVIDAATARRLSSYSDIKREAQKRITASEGIATNSYATIPRVLKGKYPISILNDLVVKALKSGKTVGECLVKNPLIDHDYNKVTDEKEKQRVGALLDDYIQKKRNEKVTYFEAKPQRFMRLGDFTGAVVPEHLFDQYKDLFAQHGVKALPFSTKADQTAKLQQLAQENDLMLSERDLGLQELVKSEVLEDLECLEELEKAVGDCRESKDKVLSKAEPPGLTEEDSNSLLPIEPTSHCVLTIIQDGQGKMLFIKRQDNHKWSLCAGHIEGDEDPEDAARREIQEETGLTPEYLSRIYESKNPNLTCFSAQCQGIPTNRNDPDQEGKAQWVDCTRGIPANIYDNLAGPEDESNVVRQLFTKELGLKKSEYNWLDAGFLELQK